MRTSSNLQSLVMSILSSQLKLLQHQQIRNFALIIAQMAVSSIDTLSPDYKNKGKPVAESPI